MVTKLSTLLLLFCWLDLSLAQDSTLVFYEKITHLNDAEKRIFGSLKMGEKVDAIALMVAIDGDGKNSQWKVEDNVGFYSKEFEKERKKGTEKFVKALHKSLHANQLRYYQEVCNLPETMDEGAYNCVSATALFALIFDKVGYAYAIHQTPNHVYLVVEPQGANIVVETTTDSKAQLAINDEFKKTFLEYLQKTKQLSPKETAGMDNEEIFTHYYFGDEVITLQQLAGIQYYNDGLLYLGKKEYDKALSQFEKAYFLYPSERFRFLMVYSTASLLDHAAEKTSPGVVALTGKFLRYSDDATAREYVQEEFEASTLKLLLQKPDVVAYNAYSEGIMGEVRGDSALNADLMFTKYFFFCKYHGLKQEFDKAKHFAEKAFLLNPDHLEVKHLLMVSELELLRTLNTPSKETVDSLNIFCAKYPAVCEFPDIKEVWLTTKIYALLLQFEDGTYDKLSPAEIHKLRIKLVEDIEPQLMGLRNNSKNGLHGIYAEIAAHEFRMMNYETAKDWLRRGLKIFPNNSDLKTRLKNMEAFTKD
jgi:tetratricopeptide (TPR) repeat protein